MTDTPTLTPRASEKPAAGSYIEWSAIFAGAFVAAAIIVLMTAFGSAIGLSIASPYKGHSALIFYIALAIWFIWITISSFVAGGYIAGRMRRPLENATIHESHVRDGVHGLVVWAVAVGIGTWLATWTISSTFKGGAELEKSGASSTSGATSVANPIAYDVDTLLRPNENISTGKSGSADTPQTADASRRDVSSLLATSVANGVFAEVKTHAVKIRNANEMARKIGAVLAMKLAPNTPVAPNTPNAPNAPNGESRGQGADKAAMNQGELTEASRQEISRILSTDVADGSLSSEDHAYLVRLVAARAGISQADAEKRVDAMTEKLKSDADKTRKAGVILAFLTTATLVVGAGAAWWGAGTGGRHRDEKFDASHLTRW